ncbi:hypothetical protein [Enterococcus sp. MMGLQ5-1]|uniref:hypothetical protein n=1 Tax=Enterococcus sp. MMGLQ5-1 TaxID=2737663 RepID=UPI0015541244|nr:hypothetical protein [Enterococcus sp. MMGLQ5-1]MBS7585506.1 hypothetical protein [Enterococcus sp. MMGLQ5-1]NPD13363.1 hypothetical protein [Enterococcus sp. MMGLQ5-1]
MAYEQTYIPNIDIDASAGMCLQYVDNAINATERTYSAQIAYSAAQSRGWIRNDTDFPTNVWVVLFWEITSGYWTGYGHVALAFIGENGAMQIHDSEVHRGARYPYGSLQELANWFSGTNPVRYLGWSIGCDGRKILKTPQETQAEIDAQNRAAAEAIRKAEEEEALRIIAEIERQKKAEAEKKRLAEEKRKRESDMAIQAIVRIKDDSFKAPFVKDSVWFWSMETGFINLPTRRDYEWLDTINKYTTGKPVFRQQSSKDVPFHLRLAQWNPAVNVKEAKACIEDYDKIPALTD